MKIKRRLQIRDGLNILAILLLCGLFAWIGRAYVAAFGVVDSKDLLASAENLQRFILSYGQAGLIVMIGLHALHVIISFIPSVLVQFVGGLIYGLGWGMLTGIIGILLGTVVSFSLSRLLGRRVVTLFVSEKHINKLDGMVESDTGAMVLLLMFLLPVPKDFIAYFVGLSKMRAGKFFLISTLGRLPGMLVATYLGAHVFERNYLLLAVVVVISSAVGLASYIFRDKLLSRFAGKKKTE